MPSKNPAQRLSDIIDAIHAFTAELDFQSFRTDLEAVDEVLIWHTVRHGLANLRSAAGEEFLRLQADLPPNNRSTDG